MFYATDRAWHSARFPIQPFLIALAACLLSSLPSGAATIVVDEVTCTLVDAILAANEDEPVGGCPAGSGADTISLAVDVTLTEPYSTGFGGIGVPLPAHDELTILGNHHTIARADGAPKFRFMTQGPSRVTLEDLTISGFDTDGDGGALFCTGFIRLYRVTLTGNSSGASGGAIECYCALEIESSTITGNSAQLNGGGIRTENLEMENSTVSHNTAGSNGGGIYAENAGFSVTNSTISGNSATNNGGGIYNTWFDDGPAILYNATVAGNHAGGSGGGLYQNRRIFIKDSILGNNGAAGNCGFPTGEETDLGNNFDDDGTCGTGFGTLTGLDPNLADNGGLTLTHALHSDSSAVDAAGACGLDADQRGAQRIDGACDSGAYEFRCHIDVSFGPIGTAIHYRPGSATFDLVSGNLSDLLATGDYSGASCAGTGYSGLALDTEPGPDSGEGRYYLARGVDHCVGADYGNSSLDPDPRDALTTGPCP